jgi:hypothetical protein
MSRSVICMRGSKRIEMKAIRAIAEWVRRALRSATANEPATDSERKLQALRQATAHSFPTADIEEMLAHIEGGAIAKHRDLLARQAKAMVTEQAKP